MVMNSLLVSARDYINDCKYKVNRRKDLTEDILTTPLKRCLTTLDITLLGKYGRGNFPMNIVLGEFRVAP